jgi:hypothetical protein
MWTDPVTSSLGNVFTDPAPINNYSHSSQIICAYFFGERPSGPILGASAEDAPTSPPVALKWLYCEDGKLDVHKKLVLDGTIVRISERIETDMTFTSLGSNFGAANCQLLLSYVEDSQLTHCDESVGGLENAIS